MRLIATHVPPYFNYADDGSVSGIGADILKAAGKNCNIQIELSNHTWARALRHAEMGHADAIAPLAKTNGRDKTYIFSEQPIFTLDMAVFTLKENKQPISTDLRELYGKTIGTIRNVYISEAFEVAKKQKRFKLAARERYDAMALSISRNRLYAFVGDRRMGEYGVSLQGLEDKVVASEQSLNMMPVYLAYSRKAGRTELYSKFDKCLTDTVNKNSQSSTPEAKAG
ncbi:transporter substrate-binding domain-containing protein [Kordiimonas sp. SCSIO 12603]|uniref:substrate-binding periplasmic protein n=1 Tax=Kordiimonas sp. SCSIO 12603 TaxID=2829596 RepID=UPI002108217A|nr:transporter substrate-binding domain-containing protein [Kordiimonas sp. SCSIO 12603]UTW59740.1 transporter substrate-binding domain-containing protein [Kordiimonas sp. SCSIO 12603]